MHIQVWKVLSDDMDHMYPAAGRKWGRKEWEEGEEVYSKREKRSKEKIKKLRHVVKIENTIEL